MNAQYDVATVVILSALALLLLIGVAVILLIVVHQRRMRHRADMMELHVRHVDEVRQVEREVMGQTLAEVGMELHDNVGQLLTAMRLDLNAFIASPNNEVPGELKGTLDNAIAELRRLSHTLNADRLRERPFAEALAEECMRLHKPGSREVMFMTDDRQPVVKPDHKVVLYRIFQEAMNNALKHARATRIDVSLAYDGILRMSIQDNGVGFDIRGTGNGGQGMGNIRKRAQLIGCECHIESAPGAGTTVIITQ